VDPHDEAPIVAFDLDNATVIGGPFIAQITKATDTGIAFYTASPEGFITSGYVDRVTGKLSAFISFNSVVVEHQLTCTLLKPLF
jgi:hypothetical protein